MASKEQPAVGSGPEMTAELERLVTLVEASRVDEARRLAAALVSRWPDSRPIQHLHHVLQPPRATSVTGSVSRSFRQELRWIQDHAHEYPGCWLAIYRNRLVAARASRREAVQAAREALGGERALIFFHPADSSPPGA